MKIPLRASVAVLSLLRVCCTWWRVLRELRCPVLFPFVLSLCGSWFRPPHVLPGDRPGRRASWDSVDRGAEEEITLAPLG